MIKLVNKVISNKIVLTKNISSVKESIYNLRTALRYKKNKEEDEFRKYIEIPSIEDAIGNDLGDCVDLGCGFGFYTEKLRMKTTGKVVGLDVDEFIINLAKELYKNKKIDFLVHDCNNLYHKNQFDFIFSSYLLQYANSDKELENIIFNSYQLLRDEGKWLLVEVDNEKEKIINKKLNNHIISQDNTKVEKFLDKVGFQIINIKNSKLKSNFLLNKNEILHLQSDLLRIYEIKKYKLNK